MNKELQNKTWSVLPKEFKEEVKRMYETAKSYVLGDMEINARVCEAVLSELFGIHNLTSDAEGEEMLTVSRKRVQELYNGFVHAFDNVVSDNLIGHYMAKIGLLKALFGSKCLPDKVADEDNFASKEPKPTGPNFKVGDYARYKGDVHKVVATTKDNRCYLNKILGSIDESDLEPYTEPEEKFPKKKPIESKVSVYLATKEEDDEFRLLLHRNGFKWHGGKPLISLSCWSSDIERYKIHHVYPDKTVTYSGKKTSEALTFSEFKRQYFGESSRNLSQETANCIKEFDNILKDSFSKERRLNIAAMAMQGILSNHVSAKSVMVPGNMEISELTLAEKAVKIADTLIAEAEKGGTECIS